MYELMVTVSLLVDDIHVGVERLRHSIGIPEPRPRHFQSAAGLDAVFCRVHPKYAIGPTCLELVAPATVDGPDLARAADSAMYNHKTRTAATARSAEIRTSQGSDPSGSSAISDATTLLSPARPA